MLLSWKYYNIISLIFFVIKPFTGPVLGATYVVYIKKNMNRYKNKEMRYDCQWDNYPQNSNIVNVSIYIKW